MNNAILSMVSMCLKVISNLAIVAIYSHTTTVDLFSYIALGLLSSQIVCIFIDAGVNMEIMRFSRVEKNEISIERLIKSTLVRCSLGLVFTFLLMVVCYFRDATLIQIAFFGAAILSGVLSSISESYYINMKAKNKFFEEIKLVFIQTILLVVFSSISYFGSFATIVGLVFPRILLFYYVAIRKTMILSRIKELSFSIYYDYFYTLKYYSLDSILSSVNFQMDNMLVVSIFGRETYGLYQPLSKLNNSAINFVGAIASYVLPLASEKSDEKSKWLLLQLSFSIFGILCGGGFYAFSPYVIEYFFNPIFMHDMQLVTLLSLIIIVRCICAGSGAYLTLSGFQKFRSFANFVFTMVSAIVGYFLSNTIEGVLLVVLSSQFLLFLLYFLYGLIVLNKLSIK